MNVVKMDYKVLWDLKEYQDLQGLVVGMVEMDVKVHKGHKVQKVKKVIGVLRVVRDLQGLQGFVFVLVGNHIVQKFNFLPFWVKVILGTLGTLGTLGRLDV